MSDFAQDIRRLALNAGADFFGVADLTPAHEAVVAQGGESLAEFPRAIAIGIRLPDAILEQLTQHEDPEIAQEYEKVYDDTNRELDRIAMCIVDHLLKSDNKAFAVCASHRVDDDRLCGIFSHKLAAHLAGLGWIGKSCLLITQKAGPRVRWATVLTDSNLSPTGHLVEEACGECKRCVDICPAKAFTGKSFRAWEAREVRFAAQKCKIYTVKRTKEMGSRVLCGLCMSVCPHGKREDVQN